MESFGAADPPLLDRLQSSTEPRVRAVAARILARSAEPFPDAAERLAQLLADPHPRPRLEAVLACASRPEAGSLKLALAALDAGPDRFVEYSLAQAVFALEKQWLPSVQAGTLSFAKPAHLAFVLETCGGEVSAGLAREALKSELAPEDRNRLLAVLARLGGPKDFAQIFVEASDRGDVNLLKELASIAETHLIVPDESVEAKLRSLLIHEDREIVASAIRLAGFWKAKSTSLTLQEISKGGYTPHRTLALVALARVSGNEAIPYLRKTLDDTFLEEANRRAALEGIVIINVKLAAEFILAQINQTPIPVEFSQELVHKPIPLLPTLLQHPGGPAALAAAFESGTDPDASTAQEVLNAMNRLGRTDTKLTPLLNRAIGRQTGAPDYDPERVAAVVAAIREGKGDAAKGAEVYQMAQLACVACHQIGDKGGVIGPALNGVGAGMPLDQIVESILWPDRQIKEGYQAITFTTTKGTPITGYIERESEDIVWYRNTVAPWIVPLTKKDIVSREAIPTLMPPGLTASLTEQQFLDLVAYLASLKG